MKQQRRAAVLSLAEALEKPLPKPERRLLDYASARALEALLEACQPWSSLA